LPLPSEEEFKLSGVRFAVLKEQTAKIYYIARHYKICSFIRYVYFFHGYSYIINICLQKSKFPY